MSIINYNNPTVIDWNLDDEGNAVSELVENETKQVVDGKIVLEGIPDIQGRVQIDGFIEVDIKDKIDSLNKFKCDYVHGVLYFHIDKEGKPIIIKRYYSRGMFFTPASRVWTKLGINGKVVNTMDSAFEGLDKQSEDISNLKSVRIHEGTIKPTDTRFWYDPSDNTEITRAK